MTLEEKIDAFKKEIGDPGKLTDDQKKIYYAFIKTSGSITYKRLVCKKTGQEILIKIDSTKCDAGTRHILMKHYKENIGRVTAHEILKIYEVIENGVPEKSNAYTVFKYYCYSGSVRFCAVLRITEDGMLKSFYSDRGIKNKKAIRTANNAKRTGHQHKQRRLGCGKNSQHKNRKSNKNDKKK